MTMACVIKPYANMACAMIQKKDVENIFHDRIPKLTMLTKKVR